MIVSDNIINDIINRATKSVLYERKVLKLSNNNAQPMDNMMSQQAPPMPPMNDPMGGNPNGMDMGNYPMGGNPNDMGMGNVPMGDDGATAGDSEFDTNFDAGVEADEDTDPKKYIQQLTGKLSQTLGSYNNENGVDAGLCKYVANMIIKQAAKGLDEKNRKDIIKAINTTAQDTEEMPDEEGNEEGEEMSPMDDSSMHDEQQPIQEGFITKRQLREHLFGRTITKKKLKENLNTFTDGERQKRKDLTKKTKRQGSTPFRSKSFKK